jgi:hypothetical protein
MGSLLQEFRVEKAVTVATATMPSMVLQTVPCLALEMLTRSVETSLLT